jgi:hypothetical protein
LSRIRPASGWATLGTALAALLVPRNPFLEHALVWGRRPGVPVAPGVRAGHGIELPWEMLRDWIRDADLLDGFGGTFDFGGRGEGALDEILG